MVFKDSTLLQEAYISAVQKAVNVPSSSPQADTELNPEPMAICFKKSRLSKLGVGINAVTPHSNLLERTIGGKDYKFTL